MREWCGVALAFLAFSSGASVAEEKSVPLSELTKHTPKFHALPEKTIGLLVSNIQKVLLEEGRTASPDTIGFASGEGSYRLMYLPCPKNAPGAEELLFRVGQDGRKKESFGPVCLARVATVKKLGGNDSFNLVEVEVNNQRGSPAVDAFVATKLRLLDGSNEYPLRVDQVVTDLKKRSKSQRRERAREIENKLATAQQEALGSEQKPTGPREEEQLLYATWLPDKELLHVTFKTRISDGLYHYGKGAAAKNYDDARSRGARYGTMFGVEITQAYDVDKNGEIKSTQPWELRSFTKQIPPPRRAF
jgi:hypothetical protein